METQKRWLFASYFRRYLKNCNCTDPTERNLGFLYKRREFKAIDGLDDCSLEIEEYIYIYIYIYDS